jgi:sulfide:quinone oxidoreductase
MAKILILGGGFAAVTAAETLAAAVGNSDEITVVSSSHEFTFYPALVPLIFSDFEIDEIRFDLRPKLAERNIGFVEAKIAGIDPVSRTVVVENGRSARELDYDFLLVAIGRRLATETIPGFFKYSHHLLNVDSALKFKNELSAFEAGSIVVGLCPDSYLPTPVCETALALASKFRRQMEQGKVSITTVFPSTLDRAFSGSALFRDIEDEFDRMGIRLVPDFAVERVNEDKLISALGSSLNYDLLMLVPPFRGQRVLMKLATVIDDAGFAKVNSNMQMAGRQGIYAAGDIVSLPGPRFGYMAMRQAKIAAANILSELRGEPPAAEYTHDLAWAIGEKYTDPVYFHYGFWDNTLDDFDEDAIFGMARHIRRHYGPVRPEGAAKPVFSNGS